MAALHVFYVDMTRWPKVALQAGLVMFTAAGSHSQRSKQLKELAKTQGRKMLGDGSSKKSNKNKFSELGLPGVKIVGAPLETLFTLSSAP